MLVFGGLCSGSPAVLTVGAVRGPGGHGQGKKVWEMKNSGNFKKKS